MNEADDLALITGAARAAGALAMEFFQRDPACWDKPGGAGPVTEADMAVDAMLHERLRAARPDHGWLSEETEDDPGRLAARRVFIVDPIDGTRAFVEGGGSWAISIALAEAGQIIAGAVYLPVSDRMYAAQRGGGATLNGAAIRASDTDRPEGARLLAARPVLDPWNWKAGACPPVKRSLRTSLAYRLCLVAEGRHDAMLTLRASWEWDIAAGALIVQEAGGIVTDRRLNPLRFNTASAQVNGVLAAAAPLHPKLGAALSGA